MTSSDFYEDDEPVEKVRAAYARGEKGVTRKREDFSQRMRRVVDETIERSEDDDPMSVTFERHYYVVDSTATKTPAAQTLRTVELVIPPR